jgi:hypothetical protein
MPRAAAPKTFYVPRHDPDLLNPIDLLECRRLVVQARESAKAIHRQVEATLQYIQESRAFLREISARLG